MDTLENLVTSATLSCESLLLTVYGLPSESTTSKLQDQLKALTTALGLLHRYMSKTRDEFVAVKLPVQACRDICENLNEKIKQEASSGFQDWDGLEWGGANIAVTTTRLKLYTSTIAIGMITVGMSSGALILTPTANDLYRELIKDTESGLLLDFVNNILTPFLKKHPSADGVGERG